MIRIFKYKCTGKSPFREDHFLAGQCLYSMDLDCNQPAKCNYCGKSSDETETIWDKIQSIYWGIVPYDWRPGQVWYRVACRLWRRHTTYKPRYLPHTWCDKDHIIVHMSFEILCRFVEDEVIDGPVNWDSDEEHRQAKAKMMELYEWWKANHDVLERWSSRDEFIWEQEEAHEALLRNKCKEIIDLSPWFWT